MAPGAKRSIYRKNRTEGMLIFYTPEVPAQIQGVDGGIQSAVDSQGMKSAVRFKKAARQGPQAVSGYPVGPDAENYGETGNAQSCQHCLQLQRQARVRVRALPVDVVNRLLLCHR